MFHWVLEISNWDFNYDIFLIMHFVDEMMFYFRLLRATEDMSVYKVLVAQTHLKFNSSFK